MKVINGELLLDTPAIIALLDLRAWTVYNLLKNGTLPCVRIGSRLYAREKDVKKFLRTADLSRYRARYDRHPREK